MKKNTLTLSGKKALFLGSALLLSVFSFGQCLTDDYGAYPSGSLTLPTCDLTTYSVDAFGDCYSSEYSIISVTTGSTYTFSSSNPTDLITISADGGVSAAAFGIRTVTWLATITGDVRFYTHAPGCSDDGDVRSRMVRCGTPPPPPANNDCLGAVAITGTGPVAGTTVSATESMASATCNTYLSAYATDVWYSFTASSSGNLTFAVNQDDLDAVWEVFSGGCGSLTSLGCTDNGPSITIAATSGQTYYLRVYGWNGQEGPFTVTLSGNPLPVTMEEVKGKLLAGNLAQLSWTTLMEKNNKGFDIQRSEDGRTFSSIGWVNTQAEGGNSSQALPYQFTDKKAIGDAGYYRLQQVDLDGKATLSNVVRLGAKAENNFSITASPNPVAGELTVRIKGEPGTHAQIAVTDITGKAVMQLPVTAATTKVNMAGLAKGMYLLKYTDGNQSQTLKVSRQ